MPLGPGPHGAPPEWHSETTPVVNPVFLSFNSIKKIKNSLKLKIRMLYIKVIITENNWPLDIRLIKI